MTLQDIFDHINSRTNKDQSGNTYNPQRFNSDLKVANLEMFNYLYGLPQTYQPGMPLPKIAFEITQRITDDLRALKVNMGGDDINDPGPLVVDQNGNAKYPPDYVHYSSMNYSYKDGCKTDVKSPMIDVLTDAQWSSRINSVIKNKNVKKYPYCNFQANYIRFRPKDIQYVNFVYLRAPRTPFYDYYISSDDSIVFLPSGTSRVLQPGEIGSEGQTSGVVFSKTVELEWPEHVHPDFANLMLSYVADNLRSQLLKQSAELRKKAGI